MNEVLEKLKKFIFPHPFIIFVLFNLSVVTLVYIFINHWETNILAILFYVVAFYTLVVVCVRIPGIVKRVKTKLHENKYTDAYLTDKDLRMRISMYRGLLISFVFAMFKIISHRPSTGFSMLHLKNLYKAFYLFF